MTTCVSVDCPAKTNLTLHVGERHAEWGGRHALETIYCAVGIYDTVTVEAKPCGTGFSLDLSGTHLGDLAASTSDMRRNHAVLAMFAIAEACGHEPDVSIRIDKRIPVAAGLGGGSADAAATLLALNTLWELDWPVERLREIAATLGADMPFCVSGGVALGTGFGERITDLSPEDERVLPLLGGSPRTTMLVGAYLSQLSTPEVYSTFDVLGAGAGNLNELQNAAVSLHPRSGVAIDEALAAGADRAFVSGSGPTVIAIVNSDEAREAVERRWLERDAVDRIIAAEAPAVPCERILR
ncbi:4-(cytidine 5'-diphospho)-2-C-methyl-D-erythritol kinase [Bifidobacterium canis]|uniref:4-diphosphocytidyl-2-C-methyl-D-erythritol kinase n=1 Tax=Bifidobacterium canis TaxID=2610880 RepID=A0A7K1J3V0_9BIFI|nr:4-(cytidine 5'-diphospho)-2-C-methyl-D-erythritol kinase [Bifidobacterium canis]MUH59221.1 4-diphosphocytidyl-2C-methyl-D-erythritol kinase [Bifidobacterium canis]